MEKIIGIFDEQTTFAERFKRYINDRKDLGYFAVSFQEEQELIDFCGRKKPACLVLGGNKEDLISKLSIPYGVRLWVLSEEEPEVEDADGYGITLKNEKSEICNLKTVVEKLFNVTETCDAGTLSEPMGSIISSSASGIIHELKVVSDKLFLKGELIIHTSFTGTDTGEIQSLENIININHSYYIYFLKIPFDLRTI